MPINCYDMRQTMSFEIWCSLILCGIGVIAVIQAKKKK